MAYTKNDSIQKVKAKEYIENAAEREAMETVWQERRRMERFAEAKDLIEAQLSLWDGSHSGVVEVVKPGLNDPESFEHLQTSWMRGGGYPRTYMIIMDFTAKNLYGGRMRHVIKCEVVVETGEVAQVFSIE